MEKVDWSDKKVVVMGLGVHGGGVGNVKWLAEQGANLIVTDLRSRNELEKSLRQIEGVDVELCLGEHKEEHFKQADIVVRSPAVPRDSKYLKLARANGARIEMDSSIFFQSWPREKIIGVTGSKGKSSCASFLTQLLSDAGIKVVEVGGEGEAVLPKLAELEDDAWAVFELSSWRLEALAEHELSPGIAVVTSIYRDHLNTYNSFEDYVEVKQSILKHQKEGDVAILNHDDENIKNWESWAGTQLWFGMSEAEQMTARWQASGMYGALPGCDEILFPASEIALKSVYEIRNVMPGVIVSMILKVPTDRIRSALGRVKSLQHRMEGVRVVRGVRYINDSAATIPEAAIAALQEVITHKVVMILGGSDKQLDFDQLGQEVSKAKLLALVWLPGNATNKMQSAVDKMKGVQQIDAYNAKTMDEAVRIAAQVAEEGGVVLMSPGATSFGLFKHEFDRGEQFKTAVGLLPD